MLDPCGVGKKREETKEGEKSDCHNALEIETRFFGSIVSLQEQ